MWSMVLEAILRLLGLGTSAARAKQREADKKSGADEAMLAKAEEDREAIRKMREIEEKVSMLPLAERKRLLARFVRDVDESL